VTLPWGAQQIAVIGDVMLDEYLDGEVVRISPEAPVPVVNVKKQFCVPGGAANAACGVQALGGATHIFSALGSDETGLQLQMLLKRAGIKSHFVMTSRPTTRKTRVVSGSHQLCRVDREYVGPLPESTEKDLTNIITTSVGGLDVACSAILLSDYGKSILTRSITRAVIELATEKRIPVVVDPKGRDFSKYEGATLITPNYKEACEALGVDPHDGFSGADLGKQLLELYDFTYVLVTLGAEGMVLVRENMKPLHLAAVAHEVFDVSGAGDIVAAVMTLSLSAGLGIEDSMWLANVAAGIAVTKQGTQTVSADELVREAKRQRNVLTRVKNFFSGL